MGPVPNGGGISTGGAVITAWFFTAPLLQLTLMPVTERYLSIGRLNTAALKVPRCPGELSEEGSSFLVVVLTILSF